MVQNISGLNGQDDLDSEPAVFDQSRIPRPGQMKRQVASTDKKRLQDSGVIFKDQDPHRTKIKKELERAESSQMSDKQVKKIVEHHKNRSQGNYSSVPTQETATTSVFGITELPSQDDEPLSLSKRPPKAGRIVFTNEFVDDLQKKRDDLARK